MKNLIKNILFVLPLFMIITVTQAQRPFSGIVEYEISYAGELDPATLAMLPQTVSVEILGQKSKLAQQQGVLNIIKISNAETFTSIVLMDIMGQKYCIKTEKDEIEESLKDFPVPTITITEETKTIAGYEAKKALFSYLDADTGEEVVEEIYFTPEIGGENFNFDTPYRGIPGLLLEYSTNAGTFTQKMVAKDIKKKKIKPTSFMIPTDYQTVTADELREIFEGM
ncbi:MAG: hypothetical protein PHT69_06135 [Bacteroidales bacterium]|nr:hypothetical protein [Bacteroidales bacterium]